MLTAFKEKLNKLINDPSDPYRALLIARVGPREAMNYEAPLRGMILAMPRMLTQLSQWSQDLHVPEPLRRAHMFTLAYLYNPEDFLPEKDHGFFGYLDDAYMVASMVHTTLEEVGMAGMRPLIDDLELARSVPGWVELSRRILPEVTEKIDHLLSDHIDRSVAKRMLLPKPRSSKERRSRSAPTKKRR